MAHAGFSDKKIGILLCFIVILATGCATTNVAKMGDADYCQEDDERRMQKRADEMCEKLDNSQHIYDDVRLSEYLTGVLRGLLRENGNDGTLTFEVKVINDPSLNAFALPNGRIYVHTGMLAAIENEAQLATLLAHELNHILYRHSLKQFRSIVNKSAFFASLQAPTAAFVGDLGVLFTQLAVISSIYGYSRDQEYEADREGFKMVLSKRYDIRESVKLFENLKEFIEAEEVKQPFFFSTHPHVVARIRIYNGLINDTASDQHFPFEDKQCAYIDLVNELILNDICLCLQEGMFKTGEKLIKKFIENNPDSAQGYFYFGELFRQRQDHEKREKKRDKVQDYVTAIESYDKALECEPPSIEALRSKGNVFQKQGKTEQAKEMMRKYLEVNPDAPDKEYVRQFLSTH